jgi:hypothetical protein
MATRRHDFKYAHALTSDRRRPDDDRLILSLHSQATSGSSWSKPFEDHMQSNEVRSNRAVRRRIQAMLENVAQYGEGYYNREPKLLRSVGDQLWELKPKPHRLLMFMDRDVRGVSKPCWLIADAFKKPQPNVQDDYIKDAKKLMEAYFAWK